MIDRLGRIALVAGIAAMVTFAFMFRVVGALKPSVAAIQVTFTESAFRSVLASWGADGRDRFAAHFAYDYLFLLLYGLFGWALGGWLANRIAGPPWLRRALPWLLPAAAVADIVEDALQQSLAAAAPGSRPALAYLVAGSAAALKWALIGVFTILVFRSWWLMRLGRSRGGAATDDPASR